MRAKLGGSGCCVVLIALGVHCACAAPPAALRQALAEFETGATRATTCAADYAIGTRKEISRFQILPVVWRQYSRSRTYHDPQTAWAVTTKILADREAAFRKGTGREWDAVDIYIMWNAPGQYQRANWDRRRVSPVVLERAQRFANLLEERSRPYANQNVARN